MRGKGPLAPQYLLRETPSRRYLERTEWNVRDSDATLIFTLGGTLEGGSARTADFARVLGKPWLRVKAGAATVPIAKFLAERHVVTLNVAGTRASRAP
jgi:hypothetical protein